MIGIFIYFGYTLYLSLLLYIKFRILNSSMLSISEIQHMIVINMSGNLTFDLSLQKKVNLYVF